jgi:uncharacterized repeat protein (TIGR01451 family)
VDLQNMVVSDPRLSSISCSPVSNSATLPVGQTTICQGSYTTTQADILNGSPILNTASVVTSRTSVKTASATVLVQQTAMFTIQKSTNVTVVSAAGQAILYTIVVQNTGTKTLTNFQISDPLVQGGTGRQVVCSPSLGGSLAASATATCTASYIVTQADMNAGRDLVNVATAQFVEFGPLPSQVSTSVQQQPSLTLGKTVSPTSSVSVANTRLIYTITVANRGNIDLTNYQIFDPVIQNGNNDLNCQPALGSTITANGPTATCTGTYTVTQQDLNTRASIVNVATVTTQQIPVSQPAQVSTALIATPSLTITKTASVTNVNAAGTPITYTIVVRNGGNVDLDGFTLLDTLITQGQNDLSCNPTPIGSSLKVGTSTTCGGSYIVTSSDMSAGVPIVNVAVASAQRVTPQSANATTTITQLPSFVATKAADVSSVNAAGNIINYSITIRFFVLLLVFL